MVVSRGIFAKLFDWRKRVWGLELWERFPNMWFCALLLPNLAALHLMRSLLCIFCFATAASCTCRRMWVYSASWVHSARIGGNQSDYAYSRLKHTHCGKPHPAGVLYSVEDMSAQQGIRGRELFHNWWRRRLVCVGNLLRIWRLGLELIRNVEPSRKQHLIITKSICFWW